MNIYFSTNGVNALDFEKSFSYIEPFHGQVGIEIFPAFHLDGFNEAFQKCVPRLKEYPISCHAPYYESEYSAANGTAPYPVMTPWGVEVQQVNVEIDEALLKDIASATGGRYFRATDNTKLSEIYSEINRMEKTRTTLDSFPVYKELFATYAIAALLCLIAEMLLRLLLRRLP